MPLDRKVLAEKLKRYREQFQVSILELSEATGIPEESLSAYENEEREPTGDEILILADFYRCDFRFFISNERVAPFDQTETLFRRYGDEFSKQDRWAVQEVLFLAGCESFLFQKLEPYKKHSFTFTKTGDYYKGHGIEAAAALRRELGYPSHKVPLDIYEDFRSIGIHVFRRKLRTSSISGLYIRHPVAGKCILINYSEDIYRQRFTAAHEAAHRILDDEEDVVVSFTAREGRDLVEIRANTFASHYLMPPEFLKSIPGSDQWNPEKALTWANELKVSTEALSNALSGIGVIDRVTEREIKSVRVPQEAKTDPELSSSLSSRGIERKSMFLQLGLSSSYVNRCFEAYRRDIISAARMAEMMLVDELELYEIAELYGEEIRYGS